MPAEIINLNKARKAKRERDRKVEAGENRARFGRSGAEKDREAGEAEKWSRLLDGHRLDSDGEPNE